MNKFLEDLEMNMQKNCFCGEVQRVSQCENKREYGGVTMLPKNPTIAMAYVPFQTCTREYEADEALCKGTLFPSLDKPFLGGKCI